MLEEEYEAGFPVEELAAGQSDAGGVIFACAARFTLGGRSLGSAIEGSKRLPARTDVATSLLPVVAGF